MEAVTLADLAAVIAAVLGPVLLFAGAMMRYQHVDNIKTRDLIDASSKESRELIGEVRGEVRALGRSVGDARERLARIEGRLGVGSPPPQAAGGSGSDGDRGSDENGGAEAA